MKIENRDIFEQIGTLFYAVATDQQVTPLELGELKSLISKDWLPRNPEVMISSEAHWILMKIDGLKADSIKPEDAYVEFSQFYRSHPEVFNAEVRNRVFETCREIVQVFNHKNANAVLDLASLKTLLNIADAAVAS